MDFNDFDHHTPIEGTTLFDGKMAMKGYALNKMCYSFNGAEARQAYLDDPEAYMESFGLNEEQKAGLPRQGGAGDLIAAGGNIYYLAKFAGIFKLDGPGCRRAADRHDQVEAFKEKAPQGSGEVSHG